METKYIYTLKCPKTNKVRYVGMTKQPKRREYQHGSLVYYRDKTTHVANWCKGLFEEDLKPLFEIIDEVSESNWIAAEKFYIDLYKNVFGCDLVNHTLGGDGVTGYIFTEADRKKISDGCKGMVRPKGKDHPLYGRKIPQEVIEKRKAAGIGSWNVGRILTEEHKQKVADGLARERVYASCLHCKKELQAAKIPQHLGWAEKRGEDISPCYASQISVII